MTPHTSKKCGKCCSNDPKYKRRKVVHRRRENTMENPHTTPLKRTNLPSLFNPIHKFNILEKWLEENTERKEKGRLTPNVTACLNMLRLLYEYFGDRIIGTGWRNYIIPTELFQ